MSGIVSITVVWTPDFVNDRSKFLSWYNFLIAGTGTRELVLKSLQLCGLGMFILDPGSRIQGQKGTGSRIHNKDLSIFNPINYYSALEK